MEPIDLFQGDTFHLNCSVAVYAPERVRSDVMRFAVYKDNVSLVASDTYQAVANADSDGNYTCKVQGVHGITKESKGVVIKAKGESWK